MFINKAIEEFILVEEYVFLELARGLRDELGVQPGQGLVHRVATTHWLYSNYADS